MGKTKKKAPQKVNNKSAHSLFQMSSEQIKKFHQQGVRAFIEGEKRMNDLNRTKREAQKKGQVFNILEYNRKNGLCNSFLKKKQEEAKK